MKFRIEHIFKDQRPVMLLARQLEAGDFQVTPTSNLGGVAVMPQLSMPRSLLPDGKPDMTIFSFTLVRASDVSSFALNQVVELQDDVA